MPRSQSIAALPCKATHYSKDMMALPRRIHVLGSVVVLVVLCASCKKDASPTEAAVVAPLLPLNIGNFWIYNVDQIDSEGHTTPMLIDTTRVSRIDTIRGKIVYSGRGLYPQIFTKTDGYYSTYYGEPDILLLKYPCLRGDSFSSGLIVGPGFPYGYTVVSVDTLIATPAGSFYCIAYRHRLGMEFYAPGVGRVLSMRTSEHNRSILRSFTVH